MVQLRQSVSHQIDLSADMSGFLRLVRNERGMNGVSTWEGGYMERVGYQKLKNELELNVQYLFGPVPDIVSLVLANYSC